MTDSVVQASKTASLTVDITANELVGANSGQRPDLLAFDQKIYRVVSTGSLYQSNGKQLVAASLPALIATDPLTGVVIAIGPLQTVFLPLTVNDPTAATANTAALNALATSLATSPTRLNVVFPDGDIYINGVTSWKSYANETVPVLSTPEATWPSFSSNGTTTFRWSGAAFDGAMWTFQLGSANSQATNLSFKNIRWSGAGCPNFATAVASGSVGAAATSVTVAAAGTAAIGNAICISADIATSNVTPLPWWATITNVVGNVITFAPATPSGFAAAIANRVQIFRQGRAVQIGGLNAAIQDVNFMVKFERCGFIDLFAGLAMHDITQAKFDQCVFNRVMYGAEYGFNMDITEWIQPWVLNQINQITATVTTGLFTVTFASNATLKVGMSLSDVTAPATAQAFPEWATIVSVDSLTQVTMSHASTVTGSRSLQPVMGWLLAIGSGNSPFYPLGITGNGSRTNADVTYIRGYAGSEAKGIYICDSGTNSSITCEDCYPELTQRVAIIGNQVGVTSSGPYVFRRVIVSAAAAFTGPAVECVGSGGVNIEISDWQGGGSVSAFPLVQQAGMNNNVGITWVRNNLTSSSTNGVLWPSVFYLGGITPDVSACAFISMSSPAPSGILVNNAAATGTLNQETIGWDGANLTLTANTNFNNPPFGGLTYVKGKKFRVIATQNATGGFTLQMGASFVNQAGAALGTIAAGAAGKVCMMDFIADGTRFILVGGSLIPATTATAAAGTAGLPAFI